MSIIIPFVEDRGYLNEAIESVKAQTYPNIELILSQSNSGVSKNLNEGIKRSRGKYVKYLCDDDMLTTQSIERSVERLELTGAYFMHGGAINLHPGGVREFVRAKNQTPTLADLIDFNHIHGGTLMYRRDVFDRFGLFDETLTTGEEYDFNMMLMSKGARLSYCDHELYVYRRHDAQKSLGRGVNQNLRRLKIEAIKDGYRGIHTGLPVVVGMATMKGREKYLEIAVDSLRNQVDEIIIYDNGSRPGLTDNGKFYGLTELTGPAYYLSCDDDLIYPHTYARDMVAAINRTGTIVTHHGRVLKGKGLDYYRGHQSFRCLSSVHEERRIDVAGTGVTGFDTRYFNPAGIHKAKDKRMSDLVFSLLVAEEEKNITLLKHQSGYIREAGVPFNETIAGQDIDKAWRQIEIADEIYERIYSSYI